MSFLFQVVESFEWSQRCTLYYIYEWYSVTYTNERKSDDCTVKLMVCIRKKKYWIWLFVVIVGHKITWLASFPYTHITFSLLLLVVAFEILITVFGIRMMLVQIKHKFIFCIGQKWWCDRYNHTIGNAFLALLSGLKNFLFFSLFLFQFLYDSTALQF